MGAMIFIGFADLKFGPEQPPATRRPNPNMIAGLAGRGYLAGKLYAPRVLLFQPFVSSLFPCHLLRCTMAHRSPAVLCIVSVYPAYSGPLGTKWRYQVEVSIPLPRGEAHLACGFRLVARQLLFIVVSRKMGADRWEEMAKDRPPARHDQARLGDAIFTVRTPESATAQRPPAHRPKLDTRTRFQKRGEPGNGILDRLSPRGRPPRRVEIGNGIAGARPILGGEYVPARPGEEHLDDKQHHCHP